MLFVVGAWLGLNSLYNLDFIVWSNSYRLSKYRQSNKASQLEIGLQCVMISCSVMRIGDKNNIRWSACTSSFASCAANFSLNNASYMDDWLDEHVLPFEWVSVWSLSDVRTVRDCRQNKFVKLHSYMNFCGTVTKQYRDSSSRLALWPIKTVHISSLFVSDLLDSMHRWMYLKNWEVASWQVSVCKSRLSLNIVRLPLTNFIVSFLTRVAYLSMSSSGNKMYSGKAILAGLISCWKLTKLSCFACCICFGIEYDNVILCATVIFFIFGTLVLK